MSSNKCHEENKGTFVLKKMIYFYVINRTYKCKDHKISQCKTELHSYKNMLFHKIQPQGIRYISSNSKSSWMAICSTLVLTPKVTQTIS